VQIVKEAFRTKIFEDDCNQILRIKFIFEEFICCNRSTEFICTR